jgi:hypothetical protein
LIVAARLRLVIRPVPAADVSAVVDLAVHSATEHRIDGLVHLAGFRDGHDGGEFGGRDLGRTGVGSGSDGVGRAAGAAEDDERRRSRRSDRR